MKRAGKGNADIVKVELKGSELFIEVNEENLNLKKKILTAFIANKSYCYQDIKKILDKVVG